MGLSWDVMFRKCPLQRKEAMSKYWQIDCHVPWLFCLLTRTSPLQIPLHLSQGSVLDHRSFAVIHLLFSLLSTSPLLPALASILYPSTSTLPTGSSPRHLHAPAPFLTRPFWSLSPFQACNLFSSVVVGANEYREEFSKLKVSASTTGSKSGWLLGNTPKVGL